MSGGNAASSYAFGAVAGMRDRFALKNPGALNPYDAAVSEACGKFNPPQDGILGNYPDGGWFGVGQYYDLNLTWPGGTFGLLWDNTGLVID
jgi:hypothetical protein